jgi:glycosyltransferase involved in cell wall biosynthesis
MDRVGAGVKLLLKTETRVLVIAQLFPPDMGGGATRAYNMAKGLIRTGCRVTVISAVPHYPTGKIPSEYRWKPLCVKNEGRIRVIRTFVPPVASEGVARRLVLLATFLFSSLFAIPIAGKASVVWAANPNVFAAFPGFIYSTVKRCPLVQNVDDLWPEALYDLGVKKGSILARCCSLLAKVAYRLASAITPISPGYTETITKGYAVKPGKVKVIRAGVDLETFKQKTKGNSSRKASFRALYIGAFSPAYDFDQIFKAAKLLFRFPDVEFVIQGGGELARVLKSKAKRLRLSNTSVLERIVTREEVAKALVEASALLLPLAGISSMEMGISSKLYEYQAAGKPIVCCSSGETGKCVSETHSGVVVRPGDSKALSEAILYLRNNPRVALEMGTNGRAYVESTQTIERVATRMKAVFRAVGAREFYAERGESLR